MLGFIHWKRYASCKHIGKQQKVFLAMVLG